MRGFCKNLTNIIVWRLFLFAACLTLLPAAARAAELVVHLPAGMKAAAAVATAPGPDLTANGEIADQQIRFHNLLADTPYDVKITLEDGTVLQGVDMSWYNDEAATPGADEFSDDDRGQIQQILDVPSFYNKSEILLVHGDHNRAAVLQQLIRDKPFHSDKGDEVIWRVELGYFANEHGGWSKLNQVSKVLRRERFTSHQAYERAIAMLTWIPELGGIAVGKNQTATVTVATRSGGAPASTQNSDATPGN